MIISATTTMIYTLSLHDALPIFELPVRVGGDADVGLAAGRRAVAGRRRGGGRGGGGGGDRKSTRLNSSHRCISYAVFCLKKKNNTNIKPCANHFMKIHYLSLKYK